MGKIEKTLFATCAILLAAAAGLETTAPMPDPLFLAGLGIMATLLAGTGLVAIFLEIRRARSVF